jgi:glycosyltransferase involved in cell wall biosynthesis
MKVCILGKYPPIEGGVSASTYWLARSLGKKGHKVFVVTNAGEVEPEYREEISLKDARRLEPRNVKVFNTFPAYKVIPEYSAFTAKLASLAIDVVRREKIDVLFSNYLLPYGVAAGLVKQATGVPWFLGHAGSDITNVFEDPSYKTVLIELFKSADLVVNSLKVREKILKNGIIGEEKLAPFADRAQSFSTRYGDFTPKVKPFNLAPYFSGFNRNLPVFTFFGKISPLKKAAEFVEASSCLPKGKFYLVFVTEKGPRLLWIENMIKKHGLADHACFLPFQPPWRIPAIMAASTCVVAPESEEEPYLPRNTHRPSIYFEAILCARCAVIGQKMSKKSFYLEFQENKHFLAVDPRNIKSFARKLEEVINNPMLALRIGKQGRALLESIIKRSPDSADVFLRNLAITILKQRQK